MFKFLSSKFKTKKWQLIVSSFGVLVAICLMFVAVSGYAWFSSNKSVTASNMIVRVGYDDVVATYKVYYKNVDGQVQETDILNDVEMHTYDSIFTSKNVYNPVAIRIQITSPSLYEASTNENSTLTFKLSKKTITSGEGVESNASRLSHYMSSIMLFSLQPEAADNNPRTKEEIYSNIYNSYFESFSNRVATPVYKNGVAVQSFVTNTTGEAGENDKVDELSFTTTYNRDSWKPSDDPHTLIFYLLINYDKSRVETDHFTTTDFSQGIVQLVSEIKNDLDVITVEN